MNIADSKVEESDIAVSPMDESDIAVSPMEQSDIATSPMHKSNIGASPVEDGSKSEIEDVDDYFENNGTYHDEKYVLQIQVNKVTS